MSKLNAVLLFTSHAPEPERAAWLASELRDRGLHIHCAEYEEVTGTLIDELYLAAPHVIVLLSATSVQSTGRAFVEALHLGRKPLPVRVDRHPKYALMADLVHVDITGSSVTDASQLNKLVRAIRA